MIWMNEWMINDQYESMNDKWWMNGWWSMNDE